MHTDISQRWRGRKSFFIDERRIFNPRNFEVAEIAEAVAKDYVVKNHYSRSFPAARKRFGLFLGGRLIGAAIFAARRASRWSSEDSSSMTTTARALTAKAGFLRAAANCSNAKITAASFRFATICGARISRAK